MANEKTLFELCKENNISTSSNNKIDTFIKEVMAPNGSSTDLNLKPIDQIELLPLNQISF